MCVSILNEFYIYQNIRNKIRRRLRNVESEFIKGTNDEGKIDIIIIIFVIFYIILLL